MSDDNVLEFREKPEPYLTYTPVPVNVTFTDPDGTTVGKFEYNRDTGKWTFEGDMEESAKKFIHFLTEVVGPQGA
jgi:hypothetical protein